MGNSINVSVPPFLRVEAFSVPSVPSVHVPDQNLQTKFRIGYGG